MWTIAFPQDDVTINEQVFLTPVGGGLLKPKEQLGGSVKGQGMVTYFVAVAEAPAQAPGDPDWRLFVLTGDPSSNQFLMPEGFNGHAFDEDKSPRAALFDGGNKKLIFTASISSASLPNGGPFRLAIVSARDFMARHTTGTGDVLGLGGLNQWTLQ